MNFLESFEDATRPDVPKKPWFDEVSMELVDSIEMLNRVVDECIETGRYGLDLETTGLDNRVFDGETKDKIVGFCLAPDGKRGYYAPIRHQKGEEHNLPIQAAYACIRRLVEADSVAVFHNAKFDHEFLQFPGGEGIGMWDDPKTFDDTNLLGWLRNTRDKNLNLKHMSANELGKEMIELEDLFGKDHQGKLDFSELDPSWEPCIWYACSDAICTLLLYEKIHPEVVAPDGKRSLGQEVVYNLEKMTLPATRWMERARIWVDQERVAELMQLGQVELFQAMCDIYDFCNEALGSKRPLDRDEHGNTHPGTVEPGWFRVLRKKFVPDDPDYDINKQIEDCRQEAKRKNLDDLDAKGHYFKLDVPEGDPDHGFPQKYDILSRQQLGPLFEELRIPDLNRTAKSDQVQTTQAEIERLDEKHGHKYPFLPKIKRLGELQKALGTYLISLHRDVGPDGTLRANYKQTGTDTGRFTTPSSKRPEEDGGTKFPIHGTPATYDKKRPQCLLGIRSAFRARPGRTMVAIDFGGVELRIATIYSGEPKWLREYFRCSSCGNEFDAGDGTATPEAPPAYCPKCGDDRIGDLHTLTGITFFGEDKVGTKQWKQMRQGAKSANFAMAYGGGPSAIIRAIEGCSEQEAARHHRSFNETYSTLKNWWDEVKTFGRKRGYVTTAFGRHYPIPDILLPTKFGKVKQQLLDEYPEKLARWEKKYEAARTPKQQARLLEIKPAPPTDAAVKKQMEINRKFKAKAERNATNGPIQGLSADITKLAMALIYRECKKRGWLEKVYMIITIHDELVFEVEDDILADAVETFQRIMTRNRTVLNMKWPVPLTTDCEVGFDWTVPWDIKDFKYRRVRPDGFQTDEKGRLFRDKETGELKAKRWPEKFVKIFGPVYGFAPVVENLTEEEGRKFFGAEWQPLALTEAPTEPTAPVQAPAPPSPVPQAPQEPHEAPETAQEAPQAVPAEETSEEAVSTPGPPAASPEAPAAPPSTHRPSGSTLKQGEVFEYRLRELGIGVADKLAHVIVHCRGRGSHPLRIVGPSGERLPWPDASIMVNDVEFLHIAGHYGI